MDKKLARCYDLDNLKAFLIILVVLGHLLEPVVHYSNIYKFIYIAIYSFHMPLFVFVSGQLLKLQMGKSNIMTLAVPYIIFQLIYYGFDKLTLESVASFTFFQPQWILWFLFSMFIWNAVAPTFAKLKYCIPIAFTIGLLIGGDQQVGYFLSLSRTLVFFPFFLCGYLFDVDAYRNKLIHARYLFLPLSLFILITMSVLVNTIDVRYFYGSFSYGSLGLTFINGFLIRSLAFVVPIILAATLFPLFRNKKNRFSYIGERTITIYLLHGLVIKLLRFINTYQYLSGSELINIVFMIIFSILLAILLSNKNLYLVIKQVIRLTEQILSNSRREVV